MQRLPRSDARFQISKPPEGMREWAVAAATRRGTPRVGLVGSAFTGSEDHDGTVVEGLTSPAPLNAELSNQQWDDVVGRAMEIGGPVDRGFDSVIGRDEWVLVLAEIGADPADGEGAAVTDPRVVRAVLRRLLERRRGRRYTIAGAPAMGVDAGTVWDADWGGAFGGVTFRQVLEELSADHRDVVIELADLTSAGTIPMTVHGTPLASGFPNGMIEVAVPLQRCDSVVLVGPLKTHAEMGVSLGFGTYLSAIAGAEGGQAGRAGSAAECALDVFALRPANIVVLGGGQAGEGNGRVVRHNVLVAGTRAVSVDAIGAAVMGFQPDELEQLHLAGKKGFNADDLDGILDYIWIRGNEIDQVKRDFPKPAGWKPHVAAS